MTMDLRRWARGGAGVAALVALSASIAVAQSAGSLTGNGEGHERGTLPGATVTVVNPHPGDADGDDRARALRLRAAPARDLHARGRAEGFKRVEKSNVILSTRPAINVGDLVLDVGNVTETVTVEADAGRLQIQTESAERSDLVTNKQLRDIALNGRNIADLFKTIPGVIAGGTATTSTVQNVVGSFNINGTRTNQHEYTVDGVTNLNLGNNTGALVTINPDALEEVKILTSNYQAEYGARGRRLHRAHHARRAPTSTAAACATSGATRATTPTTSSTTPTTGPSRSTATTTTAGTSAGRCPSSAPRTTARSSSSWPRSTTSSRRRPPTPRNIRVPTEAERGGDFSQTRDGNGRPIVIRDPLTGQPFPGNVDPAEPLRARDAGADGLFPQPNAPEGGSLYNYTSQPPRDIPRREDILRVDWQIASSHAAQRALHPQQGRGRPAARHDHRRLQLPARRTSSAGTARRRLLAHPHPRFSPTPDQRVHLRRRARRRLHRARRPRRRHARAYGVNTPLLFPAPTRRHLAERAFRGIANQAFATPTSTARPSTRSS